MRMRYPASAAIARLNTLLGLQPDSLCQDWDIEMAEPQRVEDFVDLYESGKLDAGERFALMQLIIASFDELLMLTEKVDRIWRRIRTHLLRERTLHDVTLNSGLAVTPDRVTKCFMRRHTSAGYRPCAL